MPPAPQQQQQLQWKRPQVGPPTQGPKPVPKEKWAEHEEELRRLHPTMTLDDLMALMKASHNFTPTYVLSAPL
jgi:Clr5 domain